ncbi:hypothetical protein, partial [Telluria antibiotica]|uniref:hypothetical protein n=1 Tax=Telluria antibiotica TaxID=2717319 RepID=UPI001AAF1D21
TYRLFIVKELLYSVLPCCACESLCSSAAEKRDYAVFRGNRQLFVFYSAFNLFDVVRRRSRTRTIAKALATTQARPCLIYAY